MKSKNLISNSDPLDRISYYFELLRIRLVLLERYTFKKKFPKDLFEKMTILEIEYVQIRKISELIMLMSVSAHQIAEVELSSKIREGWNAEKLLGWMSKISSHYFPCPIDLEPLDKPEQGVDGKFVDASTRRDCLSPNDLKKYYTRSGDILHEQSKAITHEYLDDLHYEAAEFVRKTKNLFQTFSFEISIGTKIVVGQLNYGEPRAPEVFHAGFSTTSP